MSDKMLAGELYDVNYDQELIKDRYKAKDILSNSVAVGNPCRVIKEL